MSPFAAHVDQCLPHIHVSDGISALHKKFKDAQEDLFRKPVNSHLDCRDQSAVAVDTTKRTYDDLFPRFYSR